MPLSHKLYNLLIKPRQKDEDLRSREFVLNVLLVGTLVILAGAIAVLLASYLNGHPYVLLRLELLAATWGLTVIMYLLARSGQYKLAAWYLVGLYLLLSIGVAARRGVTFSPAVLLFGVVIMVTGTVL